MMCVDRYNIIYYMFYRVPSRTMTITTLFLSTVKYTVQIYTPDTHVNSVYRLTVRIQGEGGQTTAEHVLYGTTQQTEGYDLSLLCLAENRSG